MHLDSCQEPNFGLTCESKFLREYLQPLSQLLRLFALSSTVSIDLGIESFYLTTLHRYGTIGILHLNFQIMHLRP
jgi:hypothetical protein